MQIKMQKIIISNKMKILTIFIIRKFQSTFAPELIKIISGIVKFNSEIFFILFPEKQSNNENKKKKN